MFINQIRQKILVYFYFKRKTLVFVMNTGVYIAFTHIIDEDDFYMFRQISSGLSYYFIKILFKNIIPVIRESHKFHFNIWIFVK